MAFTAGMLGTETPIGAVQTANGYEVAVQYGTTNQYTVWNVSSSGAILSNSGVLAGNSLAFEMQELAFNQDLNGDGMIGPLKTLVQTDTGAFGSTSLTEVGNEYFLYNSGGTGPALTTVGAPLVVGQLGAWAPIGAVQTANGYEVAVQYGTTNQYTVWNVSSSGAILTDDGLLTGNNLTLEMQELVFNQDLNGDGMIGPLKTLIQTDTGAFGSTSLTEVGNEYFLYNSGGTGPALTIGGAAFTAGMLGTETPIGAVQTANGYEVAVQYGTTNQYTVWNVSSSGAILSNSGVLAGNSLAFEMQELAFNQDLNGDGMIGPLKTLIQTDTGAFGSTSLTEVGNEYFLYNSGGTGPALTTGGTAFTAGMLGTETPIGAVQTANGYEVAVQYGTTNQYTVWNVSSSGAILSNSGVLAGNSLAFEMQESGLQPGPQWRRNDRSAQDPHSDRHRRLRLNQPHRGWQRILPLQQRWHRSGVDHWRGGFHGGHARH